MLNILEIRKSSEICTDTLSRWICSSCHCTYGRPVQYFVETL